MMNTRAFDAAVEGGYRQEEKSNLTRFISVVIGGGSRPIKTRALEAAVKRRFYFLNKREI